MHMDLAIGEDIYRVTFVGTKGHVDVRASDCRDESAKNALARCIPVPCGPQIVINEEGLVTALMNKDLILKNS